MNRHQVGDTPRYGGSLCRRYAFPIFCLVFNVVQSIVE
jgi:hypothetical protein